MKSFINARSAVVTDAIDGFLASSAAHDLCRLDGFPDIKVVLRADWDKARVAVVSGGGSGHEPAHAGFVGEGLLTAAVCGEVFASPTVDAVLAAILAVTGAAGCLLVVKNYTGDRLNFGLAAEKARSRGLNVEVVIVADDIAIEGAAQPRGIAGTLFVHKLAGAAAAAGLPLSEVKACAEDAARSVRSLGLALSTCNTPGAERQERIAADKAELGLGIHGEPGSQVIDFDTADRLVERVAEPLDAALGAGDRIALMVNSLGGTSPLEMAIVMRAAARSRLARRIDYVIGPDPLMTSLDMHGFSLTALALDDRRRAALLAPSSSAAWRAPKPFAPVELRPTPALDDGPASPASDDPAVRRMLSSATAVLRDSGPTLDALDAKVGDGDAGTTFANIATAVDAQLDRLPLADGAALLTTLGHILSRVGGGSSGVLMATFFTAAGGAFAERASWPDAFQAGLAMIKAKAGRSAYVPSSALQGVVDPGAEAVARVFERLAAGYVSNRSG